jgi:hypothetical protein
MSGIYPFTLFCTTAVVWFVTWLYAHRLLHRFCARFPTVAQQEIPYAFDRGFAHPEKAIFFFRRRAAEVVRDDPSLWQQRRRFILLTVLSMLIPALGFLTIGAVAFMETHQ